MNLISGPTRVETRRFRVVFTCIGANRAVPHLTVSDVVNPAHLAARIADYVGGFVADDIRVWSVWLDLPLQRGGITSGWKPLGAFTFSETTPMRVMHADEPGPDILPATAVAR